MAHRANNDNPTDGSRVSAEALWRDFDLAASDASFVAELTKRVALWIAADLSGDHAHRAGSSHQTLSEQTIRELLSVIDTLTRRESARRRRNVGDRTAAEWPEGHLDLIRPAVGGADHAQLLGSEPPQSNDIPTRAFAEVSRQNSTTKRLNKPK